MLTGQPSGLPRPRPGAAVGSPVACFRDGSFLGVKNPQRLLYSLYLR
jgi:hypothetical protein